VLRSQKPLQRIALGLDCALQHQGRTLGLQAPLQVLDPFPLALVTLPGPIEKPFARPIPGLLGQQLGRPPWIPGRQLPGQWARLGVQGKPTCCIPFLFLGCDLGVQLSDLCGALGRHTVHCVHD